ncbi:hypothetical protein [Pseudorhodoferax sp. Leaf267]|uniref:hypothetical protein n=1 Tax=Pseudorhodoferax sp. Leaf267 TaxID=1736316 RepID=UPI0006F47F3C|nr:hypothetical protein [Pseudorhodoferax sp. Leaf267]KQP21701.1 hypothetical protein ASF43_25695 [Pseudorhodoferax sp. Leaf267]
MKRYANLGGDSGVVAYAIAPGRITVRFRGGETYVYDASAPGALAVAEMQRLALAGRGLSTYISQHVRENYARKAR